MNLWRFFFLSMLLLGNAQTMLGQKVISNDVMVSIYEEIKTPFKYGLVFVPDNNSKMIDSPSIFKYKNEWYMMYIVFDGKGYETWLSKSNDLLNWTSLDKIMSFSEGDWDDFQKAGYIALQDYEWGGSYEVNRYEDKYWLSYLGGNQKGYEAGRLGIGIAYTDKNLNLPHEWTRLGKPVLSSLDEDARWYESQTIYKSSIIWDRNRTIGYPFVMFYNAKGSNSQNEEAERIAIATSDDMVNWKRIGDNPVIDHRSGISGDAFITKIDKVWVMFYFGAFWKPGAFERFACSYDLINWTIWEGDDLISPSEEYDSRYAHKPFVIKYNGVVYHYYCAVDGDGNRGIALATSKNLGISNIRFASKN